MANKQASLLNFFKKSPSIDSLIKNPDLLRKHEEMSTSQPSSQEEPTLSTKSTSHPPPANNEPIQTMEDEDEAFATKKLHKRLKKCVKIADDDEEDENQEKATPTPPPKKIAHQNSIEVEYASTSKAKTPSKTPGKTPTKQLSYEEKENIPATPQESNKKKSVSKSQKKGKTPTVTPCKDAPEDDVLIDIDKNEGNAFDYNDFGDSTPAWAKKENAKDAKGKRQGDPGYDPTTLYVPPDALNSVTPTMKQYWQIKSQNYDKIVLFKLGKFYELFYEDALVCHKELDLNWMGNKMHVGFPEKALERYAYTLVNKGYKVCVVEQTETPKQLEERLRNQKSGKKEKTIRREMVQVLSKGTFVDQADLNTEPKVLLSIRCRNNIVSVSFLEVGANIITVGSFQDDENYTMFKTFISQTRPVEVIYENIETNPNILKIVRNCPTDPMLSPMNDPKAWNTVQGYADLEKYYGPKTEWPETLRTVLEMDSSIRDQIILSMTGLISYLTKMLIADNVLKTARYDYYDPVKFKLSRMVLDSQALQHLEILEVEYSTKSSVEGSLLGYLDKTVSPYGKRLLRKWVCSPLLDVKAINDRLDAIEDLESLYEQRDNFRRGLKLLPDLERTCARIYNFSIKKSGNVVMFEDIAGSRLREFKKLLESLKKARDLVAKFGDVTCKSNILKTLSTLDDYNLVLEGKSTNMPEILPLLDEMSQFIVWQGAKLDIPVPRKGVDQEYDNVKEEIDDIEKELDKYLKEVQAKFGGNKDICYAHTKHRYEIEIPAKLVSGNKKPKDFEFSSKKAERERFITKYIKDTVERLEEAEEKLKNTLNLFVCFLFSYFHKHYRVWDRFIEGLAQLDCLCSLSMVSFLADGVMCRPQVYPPNEKVLYEIRDMRHPCLSANKANFVSNDIILGEVEGYDCNKNVMILTGPNMGGKSTILRQACIAAIIAQIGCYVPASLCRLSVVDRIFTRIGASDKLSEGKSTFYIEMEETVNVMKYGSMNSLAIMDELGRGTSTFDGVAIAYSVMNYIVNKLGCRTLFATHYHVLLDEFRENNHIKFFHMSSKIDHDNERVIFLYKLTEGECSNSFGLNIARISGMNKEILHVAKEKADEFERNLNIREAVRTTKAFTKITKALSNILDADEDVEENIDFISEALKLLATNP